MCLSDLSVLAVVYAQPPLLGLLLATTLRPGLLSSAWLSRYLGVRQRTRSTRFFECAAYARLTGWLRYGTQSLGFCALFLLYDLDLIFFFAEMTAVEL
jgi:hypothetical protein